MIKCSHCGENDSTYFFEGKGYCKECKEGLGLKSKIKSVPIISIPKVHIYHRT